MLRATSGNTRLVEYGIQNEGSDIRAHVCVIARRVYVYPTSNAVKLLAHNSYRLVPVISVINGTKTVTAKGYLVPPSDIKDCTAIEIPDKWMDKIAFDESEPTSIKGDKAVTIVAGMIKKGMFPFWLSGREIADADLQIEGLDIIVSMSARVQVKCDYRGGPRWHGGTGNLFLQIAECNPLSAH